MELIKFKICPECGKKNPPSLLECRYCEADLTGTKVVDNAVEEVAISSAKDAPTHIATELVRICDCGAQNAPQARKCKVCGEDISDINPVPVEKKDQKPFRYELKSFDGTFSVSIDKPLVVIGRESELREFLQAKIYVSRQHARLSVVDEKVLIENLSRTNKTFLNNKEIPSGTPTALKSGDEIGLGGKLVNGKRQSNAAYLIFRTDQ